MRLRTQQNNNKKRTHTCVGTYRNPLLLNTAVEKQRYSNSKWCSQKTIIILDVKCKDRQVFLFIPQRTLNFRPGWEGASSKGTHNKPTTEIDAKAFTLDAVASPRFSLKTRASQTTDGHLLLTPPGGAGDAFTSLVDSLWQMDRCATGWR